MKYQNLIALVGLLTLSVDSSPAAELKINVHVSRPTVDLSPHLYGLFFEDINFAADGGLYAELIQNRSFEYHPVNGNDPSGRDLHPLSAWEKIEGEGAACTLEVVDTNPLNDNNTHYLRIQVEKHGRSGVRNQGFDGIRLDEGERYDVSFHARSTNWKGEKGLECSLELTDGGVVGTTSFEGVGAAWKKFEGVITATRSSDLGFLAITTAGTGTLELDMVSLFPQDTWKGRKNGLRKDLVEALKDLNPKFLRFPGGCIAHGQGIDNVYDWKDTLGDVAERKPNWNLWGYHQTYGLGYYEYFLLCEDLGMHPLPVVPEGVSCGFRPPQQAVPMDEMDACVQDALDLIEFANGPADSRWGSVRSEMGHPEPFGMEFICIGNEPHDNRLFRERFPLFVKAIRARYPELKIIGTSGLGWQIPTYDLMAKEGVYSSDEHYYEDPQWFLDNVDRFDDFDRDKPKVFIGEYASRGSTLFNALSEAAYLTGVERNGDMVDMTCYAPLFANVDHTQWNPDLIYFDKRTVVRSANYYVQQLFARNKGDVGLAHTVERTVPRKAVTLSGSVGFGSWHTSIEVRRLKVNGRSVDAAGWESNAGKFETKEGSWFQSDVKAEGAFKMSSERYEGRKVTYTLQARKIEGNEGFLVAFGGDGPGDSYQWNVGGWGNTLHGVERSQGGSSRPLDRKPGSIDANRWYDLKVELSPGGIRCFLDHKLVHDIELDPPEVSVSTSFDRNSNEIIVKLVNPTEHSVDARIHLMGVGAVAPKAKLLVLSGDPTATNTLQQPDLVRTKELEIEVANEFVRSFEAMSVQFIRIRKQ